jgi:hypothetical protein
MQQLKKYKCSKVCSAYELILVLSLFCFGVRADSTSVVGFGFRGFFGKSLE